MAQSQNYGARFRLFNFIATYEKFVQSFVSKFRVAQEVPHYEQKSSYSRE